MKDIEKVRANNRSARKKEREDLKKYRTLKRSINTTPILVKKINALKQSPAFADLATVLEPLIAQ